MQSFHFFPPFLKVLRDSIIEIGSFPYFRGQELIPPPFTEACRKAIELDPKDASPWSNMGVAYDNVGNYDKAIECYRKAIELAPDNKKYQENLAAAKEEL